MEHPKEEKTVLIIKPDGVKRGLIGEIISRIESRGLKIIAIKMIKASRDKAYKHYPGTNEWLIGMGNKTLENYKDYARDPMKENGTSDPLKIGRTIYDWNVDFLTSGPIVAMMIEGIHAIDMIRKIVGHTSPNKAEMGTIRGDYSVDSPILANLGKRALHNIVHASGDPKEAQNEIKHWFKKDDIHNYNRAEEDIMF